MANIPGSIGAYPSPSNGGTTIPDIDSSRWSVTATPYSGWHFVRWTVQCRHDDPFYPKFLAFVKPKLTQAYIQGSVYHVSDMDYNYYESAYEFFAIFEKDDSGGGGQPVPGTMKLIYQD